MDLLHLIRRRWHRLLRPPPAEVPPLDPASFTGGAGLAARVRETRPRLERLLTEGIIPFWYPGCVDREAGGYRLNHDPSGRHKGPAPKMLMAQSHTCWFFARLAKSARLSEALPAARHGFEFLRDRLWDREHGGFLWGEEDDRKLLLGQVTALYAIAEYAVVSGDPGAVTLADEVFSTIESRCRDREQGGYWSRFGKRWDGGPEAGGIASLKAGYDHLHVLEAYTAYAAMADRPDVRARLHELIVIITGTVLRKTAGASSNLHRLDWTPLLDRENSRASYGHDLEAAWLVLDACRAVELPQPLVLDWCRSLVEHTLRWGWDRKEGGVYFAGPLVGPAHRREKVWWVQAETLLAALTLYQRMGDPRCAELYLSVLEWVENRQEDREGGDWHAIIHPSGKVTGDKADQWKDPYHHGRAMVRCLEILGS
jgi:cellobiose epimerase